MTSPATTPERTDPGGLRHAALLYRGPEHRRAAVAAFLDDAAHASEPVLALLPTESRSQLDGTLGASAAAVDVHSLAGPDNPARLLEVIERWLEPWPGPTRIVSEPLGPHSSRPEAIEVLRHEALVNVAFGHRPVSVMCPYDAEHLDAEILHGAELTHPLLVDEAGMRASLAYGDQAGALRGEPWPQDDPRDPVATLPFDGDLAALRRAVAGDELTAVLSPERRGQLVLAVHEAATNALRHGDGRGSVRLWRDGDRVVAEVRTPSAVGDPLAGRRRPDPAAPDGRGLWLINQICDLVELRDGDDGASLRMHMRAA